MLPIAYVDGTTGGMILQLVLGGFVGGFVVFKLAFQNVVHKVLRRGAYDDDVEPVDEAGDNAR